MRLFKLRNEIGGEIDLMTQALVLISPEGLGFSHKLSAEHIGDGHYVTTNDVRQQSSVAGEIVFTRDHYAAYRELVDWIRTAKTLYLGYAPADEWFYLRGRFDRLTKTEIDEDDFLRCSFSFIGGLWQRENPISVTIAASATALTYPRTYPYTYGATSTDYALTRTLGGHSPASVVVEIGGAMSSPVISLVNNATNTLIGRCNLSGVEIASGETLRLSTVRGSAGVWRVSAAGAETSLLGSATLSDNNFFQWPQGVSCTLGVSASGAISSDALIQIYEYFESV